MARTCLRILAHLILSDMTKPKGHMAQVARCLVARDPLVKDLALRLFNSLAAKQVRGDGAASKGRRTRQAPHVGAAIGGMSSLRNAALGP